MIEFRKDDGGRSAAGFRGTANDCGVRAAAIVTQSDYRSTYDALYALQKAFRGNSRKKAVKAKSASPRKGVWKEVMDDYMTKAGAAWVPMAGIGGDIVRVADVAKRWSRGRIVMRLARHYSAMIDGVNVDTWPQHPNKRVYGAWIMPEDQHTGFGLRTGTPDEIDRGHFGQV